MISFSGVFVKLAHVGPTMSAFYRLLFGSVILLLIVAFTRRTLWRGWRPFLLGSLCGLLFAGDLAVWHRSVLAVGPGLATVLGNFQVFFVAAFAVVVLHEKPGWRSLAAIPLAMLGLFLVVMPKWQHVSASYRIGVVLGLSTAVFYASYVLVLRGLQSRPDSPAPIANITISSVVTTIALTIIAFFQNESLAIPDVQTALVLPTYGLCGQVLGWVLITRSIKQIPASRVGLILLLQPTLAFVWDVLFFKRPTTPVELLGAVIALAAIYLGTPRQAVQNV